MTHPMDSCSLSRRITSLRALVVLVSVVFGFAPAADAQSRGQRTKEAPKPLEFQLAKLTKVESKQLEAKIGRKQYELVGLESAKIVEHHVKQLAEIKSPIEVFVAGRQQAGVPRTATTEPLPPQIVQVRALVSGDFAMPALSDELTKARVVWLGGTLNPDPKGVQFRLNSINMQVGSDRRILLIKPASTKAMKKGQVIRVVGKPEPEEKKGDDGDEGDAEKKKRSRSGKSLPRFRVERLEILTREMPAADYRVILGQ